jgi:hypothetical protein
MQLAQHDAALVADWKMNQKERRRLGRPLRDPKYLVGEAVIDASDHRGRGRARSSPCHHVQAMPHCGIEDLAMLSAALQCGDHPGGLTYCDRCGDYLKRPRLRKASQRENVPGGMPRDATRPGREEQDDGQAALRGLKREDGPLSENRGGSWSPFRYDRPGDGPNYVEGKGSSTRGYGWKATRESRGFINSAINMSAFTLRASVRRQCLMICILCSSLGTGFGSMY